MRYIATVVAMPRFMYLWKIVALRFVQRYPFSSYLFHNFLVLIFFLLKQKREKTWGKWLQNPNERMAGEIKCWKAKIMIEKVFHIVSSTAILKTGSGIEKYFLFTNILLESVNLNPSKEHIYCEKKIWINSL